MILSEKQLQRTCDTAIMDEVLLAGGRIGLRDAAAFNIQQKNPRRFLPAIARIL